MSGLGCQGTNCGTSTGDHSKECLRETAKSQGWEMKVKSTMTDEEIHTTTTTFTDHRWWSETQYGGFFDEVECHVCGFRFCVDDDDGQLQYCGRNPECMSEKDKAYAAFYRNLADAAATKEREKIIAWFEENYNYDGKYKWTVDELRKLP